MVLKLSGYRISRNAIGEVATILNANQLLIGQRYMEPSSKPEPMDWQYLTVEQSSADHHRLLSLFKSIYKGEWINAGVSKGGESVLFHRRLYPEDVEVTVAKVAPICFEPEDPRLDTYLNDIAGTAECRNTLRQFQRRVLQNKENILTLMDAYVQQSDFTFSMNLELMLEYIVLEYPFAFWQYGSGGCENVPGVSASPQEMHDHLLTTVGFDLYSDEYTDFYGPIFYQLFTELGYYGFITEHLEDLLTSENYSNAYFAPPGVDLIFDPTVMQDVNNWLQTQGNNIIYVYGGRDTWTAAAVELTGQTNALKLIEPGADHHLNITEMTEKETVYDSLESWLDVEIDRGVALKYQVPSEILRQRFFDNY